MIAVKKQHFVHIGYVLAVLLLMSSAVYFFAANWEELTKPFKISLSVILLLAMYAIAYFGKRFLPTWFMVSGTIAFGIALALVDQVYNAHPESYTLFLIWLVPAVLYAAITKMEVYKVLSYMLLNSALYLWGVQVFAFELGWNLLLAVVNIAIYFCISKGWIQSAIVKYIAFASFHYWMVSASIERYYYREALDPSIFVKWIYIVIAIGMVYFFSKIVLRKALLVISSIGFIACVIISFFSFVIRNAEELVFLLGLLFVVLLITLSVYGIRKLKLAEHTFFHKLIIGGVTALATVIGLVSLIGLSILTMHRLELEFFFFLGIVFIIVSYPVKHEVIRYTILLMGIVLAFLSTWDLSIFMLLIALVVTIAALKLNHGNWIRILVFLMINIFTCIRLWTSYELWDLFGAYGEKGLLLVLGVINLVLYRVPNIPEVIRKSALIIGLGFLLLFTQQKFEILLFYAIVQLLYFAWVIFFIYWANAKGKRLEFWGSFVMLLLFLSYTYYDLVWKLLHKSIALFLLGVIILSATLYYQRKQNVLHIAGSLAWQWKKHLLIGMITLQLLILGWQIGQKEILLQSGTEIKLELAPVDPRSMLQGDYVILNYAITRELLKENIFAKNSERVLVVLRQEGDVYRYTGFYKYRGQWNLPYEEKEGDIVLRGNVRGYNLLFGIEQYYVPEGTGREVEESTRFAILKVSKNGDAILVGLSDY